MQFGMMPKALESQQPRPNDIGNQSMQGDSDKEEKKEPDPEKSKTSHVVIRVQS
jgi:hypothetical protein